jgi:hypothetical protein
MHLGILLKPRSPPTQFVFDGAATYHHRVERVSNLHRGAKWHRLRDDPDSPESTIYDFLITQTAPPGSHHLTGRTHHPLATEVFSVSRSGGLNGQVVAPTWIRRAHQ